MKCYRNFVTVLHPGPVPLCTASRVNPPFVIWYQKQISLLLSRFLLLSLGAFLLLHRVIEHPYFCAAKKRILPFFAPHSKSAFNCPVTMGFLSLSTVETTPSIIALSRQYLSLYLHHHCHSILYVTWSNNLFTSAQHQTSCFSHSPSPLLPPAHYNLEQYTCSQFVSRCTLAHYTTISHNTPAHSIVSRYVVPSQVAIS